tara:strand:+ start:1893 stop:2372 length:480 start_codon:yes stop_codon:yes gene_type:complete
MKLRTGSDANHYLILYFVVLFFIAYSNAFATDIPDSTYKKTLPLLLHRPPKVMFDDRPTLLQLFVNIPDDSIKTVSIFYKTNEMSIFQEIALGKLKGAFTYKFDPGKQKGNSLSYFFVVQQLGAAVHAVPIGDSGKIKPYNQSLVDAIEYYEKRLKSLQ